MCRVLPKTIAQLVNAENALVNIYGRIDQILPYVDDPAVARALSLLRQEARERRPVDAA